MIQFKLHTYDYDILPLKATKSLCTSLFPEVLYCVDTVSVLNGEEGVLVYHPHVHKLEQEGNLCIIVARQQYVGGQKKICSLHPKLHYRLGIPPPQAVHWDRPKGKIEVTFAFVMYSTGY